MSSKPVRLWSDEPSPVDLLAFGAVAETAVEAVLDDALDPIALGISGPWGSGKSTVLKLIQAELASRGVVNADEQILVVETDPWRYDPDVGAKATLILEVLNALSRELQKHEGVTQDVEGALRRLAKRVNWVKALTLAARSSITLQLPGIDDLSSLINGDDVGGDPEPRNLEEFRQDFAELLADEQLGHVRRVVVLVDDLDRCLLDTVVDTLETMRLFLSVPKMSFVIAADEDRVADALRERYPAANGSTGDTEEPARLYLHKIVQTTLRLPALSRFDTEAYLLLLLLQRKVENPLTESQFEQIVGGCTELRIAGGTIDSIEIPENLDIATEIQFAARMTPILYEKLRGRPRRVKRFLNDLNVRSAIAERRGIELDASVVAKLMVLELLLPEEFDMVLRWLARGELRRQLTRLGEFAGRSIPAENTDGVKDQESVDDTSKKPRSKDGKSTSNEPDEESGKDEKFTDNLIRWAKLPPSLEDIDLSPYLHLAASFAGTPLIDSGLPERLRDVAANLLSASRASQKSVTDADIQILTQTDIRALIEHLGRMARDRPGNLVSGVGAILRVARLADAPMVAKSSLMAYLHLAASFAGTPLIDSGLPERLRDVAANLLSASRASQKSVTDADIQILTQTDIRALIEHLGRMARDRPGNLVSGVGAILRVARLADAPMVAKSSLMAIPAKEIKAPVVLLFADNDAVTYRAVLERWKAGTTESRVKKAVAAQLNPRAAS